MPFNITDNLSKMLESKRACKMADLPNYITLNGKTVIDSLDNFESVSYVVYALIKHDQNYHNWCLSLRSYDFNPITNTFTYLCDMLPKAWQNTKNNMEMTKTILALLSEDNLIFIGRPSLRNTSIITYNRRYSSSALRKFGEILLDDDCRVYVTC